MQRADRVELWRDRLTRAIVLAGAFAIPLVFVRGDFDMFRMPKLLLFRAEAILLLAVFLGAWIFGARRPRLNVRDPLLIVPLIAFAVMMLTTLTSTRLALSVDALVTGFATLVIYFATVSAARGGGWLFVAVPLISAAFNALLVIVQELNLWMPFGVQPGVPHHLQCTALVGNPNEIGGYLGAAALAALALRRTRLSIAAAVVLIAGLIACRTLTAMIAFAAAVLAMLFVSSWKNGLRAAGAFVVIAALLVAFFPPLRTRASNVLQWTKSGNYNALVTDRLTPFVAAWSMFADRPLVGVGPGAFAWHYYDYKLAAEERLPLLRNAYNRGVNYGEVHNDHLQVLAESGVLGYVAFLAIAAAFALRRGTWRLALPLVVFWLVLSLAQFPLETTVVRSLLVHLAALCVTWRET